jgi:hypothetical protein
MDTKTLANEGTEVIWNRMIRYQIIQAGFYMGPFVATYARDPVLVVPRYIS